MRINHFGVLKSPILRPPFINLPDTFRLAPFYERYESDYQSTAISSPYSSPAIAPAGEWYLII